MATLRKIKHKFVPAVTLRQKLRNGKEEIRDFKICSVNNVHLLEDENGKSQDLAYNCKIGSENSPFFKKNNGIRKMIF